MGILEPHELRKLLDTRPLAIQLVDVREAWELEIVRLPQAVHIPLGQLPGRLLELDPSRPVVVYCHHGIRSAYAVRFLVDQGFRDVLNLDGGIERYAEEVDPALGRY